MNLLNMQNPAPAPIDKETLNICQQILGSDFDEKRAKALLTILEPIISYHTNELNKIGAIKE